MIPRTWVPCTSAVLNRATHRCGFLVQLRMINLSVHAHFGGRPMMAAMLAEALKYMKGFSGVWFAGHDEIASWVIKHGVHPSALRC